MRATARVKGSPEDAVRGKGRPVHGQRTVQGSIHVGPGCYRGWALPVGKDATSPVLPVKGPEAEVVAGRSVPVGRRAAAARTVRGVRGLRAGAGRTPGRWSPVQGGGHLSPSLSLPGLGRAGRGPGGGRCSPSSCRRRPVAPSRFGPQSVVASSCEAAVSPLAWGFRRSR